MSREELLARQEGRRRDERLQLREARAEHMLLRRLCGQKLRQVAADFAVTPEVVRHELAWARQRQLFGKVRDYMQERLWPKGLAVMEVHLDQGNYEAARDLFQGTGLWNKNVAVTNTHQLGEGVETFEDWRISRAQAQAPLGAAIAEAPPAAAALAGMSVESRGPQQLIEGEGVPTTAAGSMIGSPPAEADAEDAEDSDVPQQQQPDR